jgi:hypothetical protein
LDFCILADQRDELAQYFSRIIVVVEWRRLRYIERNDENGTNRKSVQIFIGPRYGRYNLEEQDENGRSV